MNCAAVNHSSVLRYRQPLARNRVRFRLIAAASDLRCVELVYRKRDGAYTFNRAVMHTRYCDKLHTEWLADVTFSEEAHYIKYCFSLTDQAGETLYFCEHGFSSDTPKAGLFELLQVHKSDISCIPEWAKGCVYYQVFPERFAIGLPDKKLHQYEAWSASPTRENFLGGDLVGIKQKIPYLQKIGVDCLYLNPVFSANFNHKYATRDHFIVDPDFGTNNDLIDMVNAAHDAGIRVVLDGVFNHVGVDFKPFADVVENGENSRYYNWFYPKHIPMKIEADNYECVGDHIYMPRLRVNDAEAREYVLSVLLFWLRTANIDGWRFDVADELDPASVRYWRDNVKAAYPNAIMLAETWGDASGLVCGNDQFDCAMNYLFRDACIDYFATSAIDEAEFDRRLQHMLLKYPDAVNHSMYNCLGSHDTPRLMTMCGGDERRAKLAYAFQMLFIGSPAIYYGDEYGMTGENDPGCRAGMVWENGNASLQRYISYLIAFRRQHHAVRSGGYRTVLADPRRHLFVMERFSQAESVRVAFNMGDKPQRIDLEDRDDSIVISPMTSVIIAK